jgi:hypothetical protein
VDVGECKARQVRDLRASEVCAKPQSDNFAIALPERIERPLEIRRYPRVRGSRRLQRQMRVELARFHCVDGLSAGATEMIQKEVSRDCQKPRPCAGAIRIEPMPGPERTLKCGLGEILNLNTRTKVVAKVPVHVPNVLVIDRCEFLGPGVARHPRLLDPFKPKRFVDPVVPRTLKY